MNRDEEKTGGPGGWLGEGFEAEGGDAAPPTCLLCRHTQSQNQVMIASREMRSEIRSLGPRGLE